MFPYGNTLPSTYSSNRVIQLITNQIERENRIMSNKKEFYTTYEADITGEYGRVRDGTKIFRINEEEYNEVIKCKKCLTNMFRDWQQDITQIEYDGDGHFDEENGDDEVFVQIHTITQDYKKWKVDGNYNFIEQSVEDQLKALS